MTLVSILILLAAGAFWLVKREEVLSLHRTTIGGHFPMGCVVAEGVAILVIAAIAIVLHLIGAFS